MLQVEFFQEIDKKHDHYHCVQMLTYGRVVPYVELFARIDAVDAVTVMETARNFIIDKATSLLLTQHSLDFPS